MYKLINNLYKKIDIVILFNFFYCIIEQVTAFLPILHKASITKIVAHCDIKGGLSAILLSFKSEGI